MLTHLLRPVFAIAQRRLWLALAIPFLFSGLAWSQEYTVTILGTLGGTSSLALAVNDAGQVVGAANVAGDVHADPFLYSNGKMTDVWTGGTQYGATAIAIGNNGHFVVNYNLNADGATESFINVGTNWADLGTGGATGMNQNDTVVGNGPHGYWVYVDYLLNTSPGYSIPDGGVALAYNINNDGSIAGECPKADPYYGGQNGCVFGPNGSYGLQYANLGEAAPFPPYVIRADGTTCGMNGISQFAEWSENGTQTVAVSLGGYGECNGLDDYGTAVGIGEPPVGFSAAGYIYDPVNEMRDLNTLIPNISYQGLPVNVLFANSISDTGFIAATCNSNNVGSVATWACLLTPNWAVIIRNHIKGLVKGDPHCIPCKTDLYPEAKSLPSHFTDLSTEEKKKATETVEKIESRLRPLRDDGRISEEVLVLLLHDTEMALRALGHRQG